MSLNNVIKKLETKVQDLRGERDHLLVLQKPVKKLEMEICYTQRDLLKLYKVRQEQSFIESSK